MRVVGKSGVGGTLSWVGGTFSVVVEFLDSSEPLVGLLKSGLLESRSGSISVISPGVGRKPVKIEKSETRGEK